MKRIAMYILIAVVVAAGAFFAFQGIKKGKEDPVGSSLAESSVPVIVSAVVQHEFQDEIHAVGTLKAKVTGFVSPKVPGNVEAVLVDIGDRVKAGQTVIRLDRINFELAVTTADAAFAAAKSAVSLSAVQLAHAKKAFRRASNLLSEKVIPQSRFDNAEAAYKAAGEAMAAAGNRQNQAKAALQTARQHLKDTQIRSPIPGEIVERNVEIGQSVAPGVPLLRVLDQSILKADIDLPESDFARVATGTPAVIKVDALKDQRFSGKVSLINPMVDRKTRTFRVRIEATNPAAKLVDGMFARVRLQAAQRTALAVERDALQHLPGSGTYYVFVVDGDKVMKRTVKVGFIGDGYAEVLDGLREGEEVVISGAGRLRSGGNIIISSDKDSIDPETG